MDFDAIRAAIERAATWEWHLLPEVEPLYLPRFTYSTGQEGTLGVDEHTTRAVFKPDVSLGLAWGLGVQPWFEGAGEQSVELEYAHWVNPAHDRQMLADVLWNSMLVDRQWLVSVDSARAYLPAMTPTFSHAEAGGKPTRTGWQATKPAYDLARLINLMMSQAAWEDYWEPTWTIVGGE